MARVSPGVANVLQPHIVELPVPVGGSIEIQGVVTTHLTLIKLGYFKAERRGAGRNRATVCVVGRGRIGGYAGLFKQPSVLSLTALTPSRVCQLPITVVYDHAFVEREFRQYLYAAIGQHIENMADWCSLVRESNISKRLMLAFELLAQEEGSRTIRIPSHQILGELVVARRESVARHIRQLFQAGRISKLDRWRVVLSPPDAAGGGPAAVAG
jgi:CRP/FNR family cyclic AMP-dependent transcriptional regulator